MARVTARMTGRGRWTFDGQSGDITTIEQWVIVRCSVSNVVLAQNGYDENITQESSMAACSCWALETGWGRAEWNYNVGNIHSAGWSGDSAVLSNGEEVRVYPDIQTGIYDWWRLIIESPRYDTAESLLLGDTTGGPADRQGLSNLLGWGELRRAGYGGSGTTAREAFQIYNRVRASLGRPAIPEASFAWFSARWWMPGASTEALPAPAPGTTRTVFDRAPAGSSGDSSSMNELGLFLGAAALALAAYNAR